MKAGERPHWVEISDPERGNARHDTRVKVSQAHGSRIDPNNTASVAIRPVPQLVAVTFPSSSTG